VETRVENAISRRRLWRVDHWKSRTEKISVSGLNETLVPVRSVVPTGPIGACGAPLRYSCCQTLPSRRISSFSHSLTAFTADTPTPCRPAETL
jgi:hypothetical protein